MRLISFAAASFAAVFLPAGVSGSLPFVLGVVAGALVAILQFAWRGRPEPQRHLPLLIAEVAVWSFLIQLSGGQRSPLVFGWFTEVFLAGLVAGGRGIVISVATMDAVLAVAFWRAAPNDRAYLAAAAGFITVGAVIGGCFSAALDRHQRKLAEVHAVLRSRATHLAEELRLLGDYLNGALLSFDELGRLESLNRWAADALGIDARTACGRPWQDVLACDPGAASAFIHVLCGEGPVRGQRMLLERSDRTLEMDAEIWSGPSPQGRRIYLLLQPAETVANASADPLRALGQAAACVSHQIRNSLHALQGLADDAGTRKESEPGEDPMPQNVVRALRGLSELAEDVLAMSGAPRPPREDVLLHDVVSSAVMLAGRSGIVIRASGIDPSLSVRAHRGRLVHALFNLIDNACSASAAGGIVDVRVRVDGGSTVVEIQDRGPGMPAPGRVRDRTRRGCGYGLVAAKRFLEAFGAEMVFLPGAEGGTVCRVALHGAVDSTPVLAEA